MARDLIGPALPPGFKALGTAEDKERDPSPVAGPALPPNYKSSSSESSDSDEDSSSLYEGGNRESEEDDTGPPARKRERNQGDDESKRSESLMDIHQKKIKNKSAEDKTKPQERIPFDRDKDLKVNRFDEAQKKALIKKSRELNTKFSHGKGSMFL
ncbi:GPALPP motifs containing 1 [Phyllostomus discolor]|uniref:GPALPP motifs-containing protein 1 n=1 Tax=Phyllostomus discolor TaxID=89673 RepID=A0A833YSD5_9CHIR|nr:GPALPP motifs containing 1 [Phyllostomus discolor]